MTLPVDILNNILPHYPSAKFVSGTNGTYLVDCSVATQPGRFEFAFGEKVIKVHNQDFIVEASPGVCYLGAEAQDIRKTGFSLISWQKLTNISQIQRGSSWATLFFDLPTLSTTKITTTPT